MPRKPLHKTAPPSSRASLPRGDAPLHKTAPARTSSTEIPPSATLRRQYVRCGKPACTRRHGPYWYAYWKEGGRTRSRYVGSDAKLAELLRSRADLRAAGDGDDVDDQVDDELPEHVEAALARFVRDGMPGWPKARAGDRGLLFAEGLVDGRGNLTNRGWSSSLAKDAWERGSAIVRKGRLRPLAGGKPTAAGEDHPRRRPHHAASKGRR